MKHKPYKIIGADLGFELVYTPAASFTQTSSNPSADAWFDQCFVASTILLHELEL